MVCVCYVVAARHIGGSPVSLDGVSCANPCSLHNTRLRAFAGRVWCGSCVHAPVHRHCVASADAPPRDAMHDGSSVNVGSARHVTEPGTRGKAVAAETDPRVTQCSTKENLRSTISCQWSFGGKKSCPCVTDRFLCQLLCGQDVQWSGRLSSLCGRQGRPRSGNSRQEGAGAEKRRQNEGRQEAESERRACAAQVCGRCEECRV